MLRPVIKRTLRVVVSGLAVGLVVVGVGGTAQAAPSSSATALEVTLDGSTPAATISAGKVDSVKVRAWNSRSLQPKPLTRVLSRRAVSDESAAPDQDEPQIAYTVDKQSKVTNRTIVRLDRRPIDPETGRMPVQWAVDTHTMSMAWWTPAKSVDWTIRVDGEVVAKTSDNSWKGTFPDSQVHVFQVEGVQKRKTDDGTVLAPYEYSVTTRPAESLAVGYPLDDPIVSSRAANRDLIGLADEADVEAGLSYRAFIGPKYVPAPWPCQVTSINPAYAFYGGDNRGFSADIYDNVDKARVSIDRTVGFTSSASTPYPLGRYVGATTAYDKNYKLLAKKTAGPSATDIFDLNGRTATRLSGTLTITGANPLCPGAFPINGKVHYDLNKSGTLRFSGVHDKAPSHEVIYFYGDWRSGVAKTGRAYGRALASNTDFKCLAGPPACADATFETTVQAAEI